MKKAFLLEVITALLVLLMLYTSFSKLFDLWLFRYDMEKQPLPLWLKNMLLWLLPLSEIVTAALLIIKSLRAAGFYAALLLMTVFTSYTAAVLLKIFPYVPCGCGGLIRTLTWPQHLLFNLFFLVVTLIGLVLQRNGKGMKSINSA